MYKKKLLVALLTILMIAGIAPVAFAKDVKRPDHFIVASIGLPENTDPAWVYDSASLTLLMEVYEPLLWFKRRPGYMEPLGPVDARTGGYVSEFEPRLATEWVVEDTVRGPNTKYTFKLRNDVMYHDYSRTVEAEDVEWAIERAMVMDHAHGPQWMFFEPLLGIYGHPSVLTEAYAHQIDDSITTIHNATGDYVVFHLAIPYPVAGFLTILAQPWASPLKREWAAAAGCWPGWGVTGYAPAGWEGYIDPAESPLATPTDEILGCGPYEFSYWTHGVEWSVVRFDDYYGWETDPHTGALHAPWCKNSVQRFTQKLVTEWATRRDGFLAGDYDNIYVPTMYLSQVDGQPGVQMWQDMPGLGCAAMFYTLNISEASPYMGVEGGLPIGDLDESGISPDFFQDENVRKGMNHLIDFETYLRDAWLNEAVQPTSPMIEGLPYQSPHNPIFSYDQAKATDYFKAAYMGHPEDNLATPEGALWDVGMTFVVCYNIGNVPRETVASMLRDGINAMGNPRFHVSTLGIEWGATYIPQLFTSQLTMYIVGWGADFADPHNFAHPFMHSEGAYGGPQVTPVLGPISEHVDELIAEGILKTDSLYETLTVTSNDVVLSDPVGSTWTDGVNTYTLDMWTDSYETTVAPDQPSRDGLLSGGEMNLDLTASLGYDPSHPTATPGDFIKLTDTGTGEFKTYHVSTVTGEAPTTMELEHSRGAYYYELGQLYYEIAIGMCTHQALGRRWQRDWQQGWYFNTMYFGNYVWHQWKEYLGDTEPDGDVDVDDLGNVLIGWPDNPLDPTQNIAWSVGTYGVPWGTDIDLDNYVDVDDLGWVLWNY